MANVCGANASVICLSKEKMMRVTGGCHCGHITYEAEVNPVTVRVCHCTDCQRLTGTAFRANIASARDLQVE